MGRGRRGREGGRDSWGWKKSVGERGWKRGLVMGGESERWRETVSEGFCETETQDSIRTRAGHLLQADFGFHLTVSLTMMSLYWHEHTMHINPVHSENNLLLTPLNRAYTVSATEFLLCRALSCSGHGDAGSDRMLRLDEFPSASSGSCTVEAKSQVDSPISAFYSLTASAWNGKTQCS